MTPNLLSNRALNNYVEQDNFNFFLKAEAIKIFLEQNTSNLLKNKMLVLYGEWGSGKTSLMRYIEQNINSKKYKTLFFHAWEHEKDENLPLSLCDVVTASIAVEFSELVKEFMKGALFTLKNFANGVTLKMPGFLSAIGLDLELSGEKIIKSYNEATDKLPIPSFFKTNEEFKEKFLKIERVILESTGAESLLIFIDDLDRCEPENVLNLITALKLFFTYGEKTIFFCGMDKDAVAKAVRTKYQDVIKSEEYLEKVFDVAFNMPRIFSLKKLFDPVFSGNTRRRDGKDYDNSAIIEDFFKSIRFTNPRHLKKIINKYEILKSFKVLNTISSEIRNLIPNIIQKDNEGNVFETIFCLFFIIIYEFHYEDFLELESYEEKIQKYSEPLYKNSKSTNNTSTYLSAISYVNNNLTIKDCKLFTIPSLFEKNTTYKRPDEYAFTKLLLFFSHSHPNLLTEFSDNDVHVYKNSFDDKEILTLFCKFLIKYKNDLTHHESNYPIWNLFEMVKYLL